MGSVFNSCTSTKHNNAAAVGAMGISGGSLNQIDDAALEAIKNGISLNSRAALKQTVQLSFAVEDLPNLDTFSKTDAFLILYEIKKQGKKNMRVQLGRTECIYDNLNPHFVTNFEVDYLFEESQNFLIEAYDMDDQNQPNNLSAQEYIGSVEFQMHQVVTAINQTYKVKIHNPSRKNNGTLMITGEEKKRSQGAQTAVIKLQGNISSESGPIFFILWKFLSPGKYKPVYKSEIKSTDRGKQNWNELTADLHNLCSDDKSQEMKIDFFKSSTDGNHKLLGTTYTSIQELEEGKRQLSYKNEKIDVTKFELVRSTNFLEYVFGGCEINLNIAIDLTLSNGHPSESDSLHCSDMKKNEYVQAIRAVGDILQYYDSDKEIPTYGFGAKVPPQAGASHCLALNGDIFAPECNGIDGVIDAYKRTLTSVQLYGPTNFSEIIQKINERCEVSEVSAYHQSYNILLIITDGVISDMPKTIDEIVRGSDLPLSIVIVGVGEADFDSMETLDADTNPLYSQKYKKFMSRDIVQFVPFREFKNDVYKLAKETLQEIPGQLTSFFMSKNIYPRPFKEEQRQKIASQLSLKSKIDPNKKIDQYQAAEKEKLIMRCSEMGLDNFQVQDLIEERGLYEDSVNLVLDVIQKPNWVNPLKPPKMPQGGFNYQPYQPPPQQQMYPPQQQPAYGHQMSMHPPQQQPPYGHQMSMQPPQQQYMQPPMGMPPQQQYNSAQPQNQPQNQFSYDYQP